MKLLPVGIPISKTEHSALLHVVEDPEQWLLATLENKITARRQALITEWLPRLQGDPTIAELPATTAGLARFIFKQPTYKTRYQQELDLQNVGEPNVLNPTTRRLSDKTRVTVTTASQFNTHKYQATARQQALTLFPTGINIKDEDAACIQAYVVDIEDWVFGALLGHINRGKKKMIAQYRPVLLSDPNIKTIPATEDRLVDRIIKYKNYETIPAQLKQAQNSA